MSVGGILQASAVPLGTRGRVSREVKPPNRRDRAQKDRDDSIELSIYGGQLCRALHQDSSLFRIDDYRLGYEVRLTWKPTPSVRSSP